MACLKSWFPKIWATTKETLCICCNDDDEDTPLEPASQDDVTNANHPMSVRKVYSSHSIPTVPTKDGQCNPSSTSKTVNRDPRAQVLSTVPAGAQKEALRQFLGAPASPRRPLFPATHSSHGGAKMHPHQKENTDGPRRLPPLPVFKLLHALRERNEASNTTRHNNKDSSYEPRDLQPHEIGPKRFTYRLSFANPVASDDSGNGDQEDAVTQGNPAQKY
ncbi:hypothetical protein HDK77DRAFT_430534 [Phyllosticta capitalensis]